MELGWVGNALLWGALGLAWVVNVLLLLLTLRLRVEVWANRRVIAALEAAVVPAEQKGRSSRTQGTGLVILLVAVGQFLLLVLMFVLNLGD